MGSHGFETTYRGSQPAPAAYDELCRRARFERGHDGYNGTISTTDGFFVKSVTPMTPIEASKLAGQCLDETSKWGRCGAIALCDAGPERVTQTTIELVGDFDTRTEAGYDAYRAAVEEALRRKLKPAKGETIGGWHVWSTKKVFRKPRVDVPTEKAVTSYRVLDQDKRVVKAGFATQALARAAAVEYAQSPRCGGPLTIDAVVRREGGDRDALLVE